MFCLIYFFNFNFIISRMSRCEDYTAMLKQLMICMKQERKIRWGSSLLGLGTCDPLLAPSPHRHQRIFFSVHIFKVTFKKHHQSLRSHTQGFGTLGQHLNFPPFVRPNVTYYNMMIWYDFKKYPC
jgi:hypothetical protein